MVRIKNCKSEEFPNIISNKNVICFGAGEELNKVCCDYVHFAQRIKAVVDNYKVGDNIKLSGRDLIVGSINNLTIEEDDILVITTIRYADEIVKQLDSIRQFNECDTYVPYFFFKDEYTDIKLPKSKYTIPKTIHYCWFGEKEIPDEYQRNIESWKKFCPNYEIVRWDESNYDFKKNEYMYEAYKQCRWGFVPDFARLDIINTCGGIYLDTDVEIIRSFDDLLGYKLFCGFEDDKCVNFGLGFGGVADNNVLKRMMQKYETLSFVLSTGELNLIASPVYQTQMLEEMGLECDGTFQIVDDCVVFPQDFFAPINPYGKGEPTSRTYSIHKYAATWYDENRRKQKERMVESVVYIKSRLKER